MDWHESHWLRGVRLRVVLFVSVIKCKTDNVAHTLRTMVPLVLYILFYARAPVPSLCNQSKILVKSPSRRDGTNFLSSCLPLSFSFSLSFFPFRDLPRPQTALLFSPGLSEARNLHARSTLTLPPYLCVACLGKLFHQRNFAIVCFLVVVFFYFSEEKEGPTMTSMNFSRACSLK